jgi:Tol biopolymer transport system component
MLDPDSGDEKNLVQDDSVGWIFDPRYSPDGKSVAVYWNREQRGIWVISLKDSSAKALARGDDLCPIGWSPNAAIVYAYRPSSNTIDAIPAAGGEPRAVFALPGVVADASVSPDGRKFVCSVAEQKSDVWLMENFDPDR